MKYNMRNPFKYATILVVSMFFFIGTSMAQEANVAVNSSEAATISSLIDNIDLLKQEKKELKSVDKNSLSESERKAWKGELREVRRELNKERNKLNTIQNINDPFFNRWGFYGPFGPPFGFAYSPFFWGGFNRPFIGYGAFCW